LCLEKKVDGYPTWDFADGSRVTGEQSLRVLAEKTGCQLPIEANDTPAPVTSDPEKSGTAN